MHTPYHEYDSPILHKSRYCMMITDAQRAASIEVPLSDSAMLAAALVDRAELRVLQAVEALRLETRRMQRRNAVLGGLAALCLGALAYMAAGLIM